MKCCSYPDRSNDSANCLLQAGQVLSSQWPASVRLDVEGLVCVSLLESCAFFFTRGRVSEAVILLGVAWGQLDGCWVNVLDLPWIKSAQLTFVLWLDLLVELLALLGLAWLTFVVMVLIESLACGNSVFVAVLASFPITATRTKNLPLFHIAYTNVNWLPGKRLNRSLLSYASLYTKTV